MSASSSSAYNYHFMKSLVTRGLTRCPHIFITSSEMTDDSTQVVACLQICAIAQQEIAIQETNKVMRIRRQRQTDRQTGRQADTDRQTGRQTDRQTDGRTDGRTDGPTQTDGHTDRRTDTDRPTNDVKTNCGVRTINAFIYSC